VQTLSLYRSEKADREELGAWRSHFLSELCGISAFGA
jgi:hypothetical protein